MEPLLKPISHPFFIISQGYSPDLSYFAATGAISSRPNFLAVDCSSRCSSFNENHGPPSDCEEKDREESLRKLDRIWEILI